MFGYTLEQVLKLFLFILIGFFLARIRLLPGDAVKTLSVLEVNVFAPCVSFLAFYNHFTLQKLVESKILLSVSIPVTLLVFAVSYAAASLLTKDRYTRDVCACAVIISNTGYVGMPLALAMFGSEAVMQMNMFTLPVAFFTFTIGANMLLDRHGFSLRRIINPPMVGLVAGALFGFFQIPVSSVVVGVMDNCCSCVGPLAMLLTGIQIASFPVGDLLKNRLAYPMVALRILIIPLLLLIVAKRIGLPADVVKIIALVQAMPTSLNAIVYPASIGKDCSLGASMACLSHFLGGFTIPILFALFI